MFDVSRDIEWSKGERKVLASLKTPQKIQDYLDKLEINFERNGDTAHSPRQVMRERRAHCIEAALLAATALWWHGEKPLIMDLVSANPDTDHIVALFKKNGHWGALSKTNHAVLCYREPVYKNLRELAMSYFHEYFLNDGRKTLRQYSDPIDLSKIADKSWLTSEKNLWSMVKYINAQPHNDILSRSQIATLRPASKLEIAAGKLVGRRR